jgi:hypothetical protein
MTTMASVATKYHQRAAAYVWFSQGLVALEESNFQKRQLTYAED